MCRDAFQNVVELLDDLFARAAAAADEPDEMNFIRKHAKQLESKGVTAGATARLFSNPAGIGMHVWCWEMQSVRKGTVAL